MERARAGQGETEKQKRNMVGASGFEPPASWSRTTMAKRINNLAMGIGIEMDFDMLFQGKNLKRIRR